MEVKTSPSVMANSFKTESVRTTTTATKIDQDFHEILITIPPDGGWGWLVVFGAFVCFLLVDGAGYSFGVFLQDLAHDLHCTKGDVSMTAAISTGVFCLTGPFAASLVNNYGYRTVGVAGSILSIISCLTTSFSKSIYLIYFTYGVLGGLGFGLIYMPAVIAVGFYFEKWRGVATGIATCGAGLGGVALPIIFTLVQEKVGWRQTFRVIAALLLLTGFCAILFRPIAPTLLRRTKLNARASGNFFTCYNNKMFPTLSEVTEVPTVTLLLEPRKLNKSSELMIMSYPSSSVKCKPREDEEILKEPRPETSKFSRTEARRDSSGFSRIGHRPDQSKFSRTTSKFSKMEARQDPSRFSRKDPEIINSRDHSPKAKITTLFVANRKRKISMHETQPFFGAPMRPLYRDDIFYDSSFNFLQKYRRSEQVSQKSELLSKSNIGYHMSVTRVATTRDLEETRWTLCTEAVKRALATLLDYKLLKSPSFLLIAFHAFFLCLGFFTTYIFIKDRAEETGASKTQAFWLISMIGVANTVGRITCGVLANFPFIEYTWLSASCLAIGGLSTIVYVHTSGAAMHVGYAIVYGSLVACIPSLRTLIIVDTLGLDKLTNAIGLILMFQGVGSLLGLSIAALLREATGEYRWSFYFAGITVILSALFFVPLKKVAAWEKSKMPKEENDENYNNTVNNVQQQGDCNI